MVVWRPALRILGTSWPRTEIKEKRKCFHCILDINPSQIKVIHFLAIKNLEYTRFFFRSRWPDYTSTKDMPEFVDKLQTSTSLHIKGNRTNTDIRNKNLLFGMITAALPLPLEGWLARSLCFQTLTDQPTDGSCSHQALCPWYALMEQKKESQPGLQATEK